ncbi:MAG TPA: flavin reductase family protein [Pyrinomonadaceae bacterium]
MPVTQDEFRAALSRFPSGITVVTSVDSSGIAHGITVSAFCSVSLAPPLVLVCIEKTAGSHEALQETGLFAVNFLAAGQDEISRRFSLAVDDKFDHVLCRTGLGGVPLLDDALVTLECRLQNAFDGGDHTIFVGQVEDVAIRDGDPLVYFHGNYRDLLEL